jgi:hypothetical protein
MGAKIQAFDIFQTPLSSHYPLPLSFRRYNAIKTMFISNATYLHVPVARNYPNRSHKKVTKKIPRKKGEVVRGLGGGELKSRHVGVCAGILKQSMGARNRGVVVPARQATQPGGIFS